MKQNGLCEQKTKLKKSNKKYETHRTVRLFTATVSWGSHYQNCWATIANHMPSTISYQERGQCLLQSGGYQDNSNAETVCLKTWVHQRRQCRTKQWEILPPFKGCTKEIDGVIRIGTERMWAHNRSSLVIYCIYIYIYVLWAIKT